MKTSINEAVTVTAMGFRKNLVAYPRRMEFRGSTYDFIDAGLRCLVKSAGKIAEIITMSDGKSDYCLRRDNNDGNWMLVSIAS
ncbi:MAG: hypothetical protein WCI79_02475 [Candidatus Saccharibacteria bacterium]